MNKQELIHLLKAELLRSHADWDSGWNCGLIFAMSAIRNYTRDYTPVFEAWKEAI